MIRSLELSVTLNSHPLGRGEELEIELIANHAYVMIPLFKKISKVQVLESIQVGGHMDVLGGMQALCPFPTFCPMPFFI